MSWRPERLLANVYVGDDAEIDRAVRAAIRPVLRAPNLAADRLPPGRREWLKGFLYRSVEGAVLQSNPHAQPCDLDGLWATFSHDLKASGVVPTVIGVTRLANDADGDDERSGWARHAYATVAGFLRDVPDQRDLLTSVIDARDPEQWHRYPAWFGRLEPDTEQMIAQRRAMAVRWLHQSGDTATVLRRALDDDVPLVRHIAAVRLMQLRGRETDDHLIGRLREAAADKEWIWSYRDHFEDGGTGSHVAMRYLQGLDADSLLGLDDGS